MSVRTYEKEEKQAYVEDFKNVLNSSYLAMDRMNKIEKK